MSFRIPCKGHKAPAKITVKFNSHQNNLPEAKAGEKSTGKEPKFLKTSQSHKSLVTTDLNIYVSQEEKTPQEGKCEQHYT